jgi:hypothetical protein
MKTRPIGPSKADEGKPRPVGVMAWWLVPELAAADVVSDLKATALRGLM